MSHLIHICNIDFRTAVEGVGVGVGMREGGREGWGWRWAVGVGGGGGGGGTKPAPMRAISQEMLKVSILSMKWKIIY